MNSQVSLRLDALRAMAALAVFCYHFTYLGMAGNGPEAFWTLGRLGVVTFFLLSGYVIAFVAEKKHSTFRDYVEARLARLLSVFLPAMVLTAVLDCIGRMLDPTLYLKFPSIANPKTLAYIPFFLTFLFENSWFSLRWLSNGPFWSIAYEFWYYILFGILTYGPAKRLRWPLLIALLLTGWKILLLAPIWFAGVLLYRHQEWLASKIRAWRPVVLVLSSVATLWVASPAANDWIEPFRRWGGDHIGPGIHSYFVADYLLALPVGMLLAGLVTSPAHSGRRPLKPLISFAAGFSFTLYLCHVPLILALRSTHLYSPDSNVQCAAAAAAILSATALLATVTEHRKYLWLKYVRGAFAVIDSLTERITRNA